MKEGKGEEKLMGPLFPRLHVNDREKGGPRAPPRNKMALYEQLSVPSQRFNSAASILSLPPHNTTSLISSASSSQVGGHERSVLSSFCVPSSTPAHSTERLQSRSSDGLNLNGAMEFERRSMKNGSRATSNFTGHPISNAEYNSNHQHGFSNLKSFSGKKSADEGDFCVPTYQQGGERERRNPFPIHPGKCPQKSITAHCSSSNQLQNACDKPLKQTNPTDFNSRQEEINLNEQSPKEAVEINQGNEEISYHPSAGKKMTDASNHAKLSSNPECTKASSNEYESSRNGNKRLCYETNAGSLPENNSIAHDISAVPRCLNGNGVEEKENVSRVRSESFSRASLGNSSRSPNEAEKHILSSEGKEQKEDINQNDDGSETSMVDSISCLEISPDDVVGLIGQKHFWKARKEIVNQQRVFAVQVFELHRLIKVQKLIAGSPDLLLENNPYLSRPPRIPAKKLTSQYNLKPHSQIIKQKDDSQKPNQSTGCTSGRDNHQKPSFPPVGDGVDKGLVSQHSNYGPYPGNLPPAPLAADNKSNPWCFHPPGNQWLVPMMSPSEGLVYKPYMGSCPPNVGFTAPVYGGCGSMSLPPAPASHQQLGIGVIPGAPAVAQNYFPPAYGLPVMSPFISSSAVEQVNPSAVARPPPQAEQVLTSELHFNMHSPSSHNMSNQKSAFSCVWKFQTPKNSEVQGSTASSPCERAQGADHVAEGRDALPLFPVDTAVEGSDLTPQVYSGDQQTRVIKVIPHNPRSATESAARIFRSIQKERKQVMAPKIDDPTYEFDE